MADKNPDELGALWVKSGSKGDYMTGTINGVRVVCFRTGDTEQRPQWRVLKSKPREPVTPADAPVIDDSDIPF